MYAVSNIPNTITSLLAICDEAGQRQVREIPAVKIVGVDSQRRQSSQRNDVRVVRKMPTVHGNLQPQRIKSIYDKKLHKPCSNPAE